jgi:salicylate hydroxylase
VPGSSSRPTPRVALRRLGLLDAVAAQAARPSHMSFRTWSDGAEICRYALGRAVEDAFGAPYLQVHRADLHQALAAAVPPDSVRLNTLVVGIDQDDDSASVTTASGERLRADLVVAADGIRSAARQWLFGADEAVFSGTAAYRALLPADEVADLDLPDLGVWLGPDRHFVHYWVRRGELLNVVAVFTDGGGGCGQESWTARAEPGEQLREFDGWDPASLASSNARDRCSATASTPGPRSRGGTSDG